MFGLMLAGYAGLLMDCDKAWCENREQKAWKTWEEYEEMRTEMGHTTDIEKIPKVRRHPRQKHRH